MQSNIKTPKQVKREHTAKNTATQPRETTDARRREKTSTRVEEKGKQPLKKKNLPGLGQPGGWDDPRRKGLSGASVRKYLKLLGQGIAPDEARSRVVADKEDREAIERCVQRNLQQKYRGRDIIIYSDSQAAIKALNSPTITSRLVWECLGQLNELGETNRVSLKWIPSHIGIVGNETADQLAKEGAEISFVGPEPYCGLGKHTYEEALRKEEQVKRETLWRQHPGLRQSKTTLGKPNRERTKNMLSLGKKGLRHNKHCSITKHKG